MWPSAARTFGLVSGVTLFGLGGGEAAHATSGIDPGVASIICAALAALSAVIVAIVMTRGASRKKSGGADDELVKMALLIALQHAGADGDEDLRAEATELAKHIRPELEAKVRAKSEAKRRGR